ncbi:prepilin-type N-terminal cleavage/methylation domain-containing protein [Lysinibacillus odysseyi]|uniref:Prepilin-type N-terminal cleavage/methylation domain-containing protein n=1 Tax=Lysinibacillus odysseyi 34hs-1 = NBRC 100172 TaxID=1220589 RepID=A0A0A3IPP7_9BACI|nr:prepilin-type N-terminal cleavage/methylation domain-containing protein [Lysinibacillus odysseyi]KGR84813.1 hypothetical protein CD32_10145 [Lysinibacillus odysseyi 34hs-1 = NBRC 100172]
MKNLKKDNSGLTLIEILAVVIILSLISIIIMNILTNSSKTHKNQVIENQQLVDVTYLSKVLTKDIRKSTHYEKLRDYGNFKITSSVTGEEYLYEYNNSTNKVYRNGTLLADHIIEFSVNESLDIIIASEKGPAIETKLYFRGANK